MDSTTQNVDLRKGLKRRRVQDEPSATHFQAFAAKGSLCKGDVVVVPDSIVNIMRHGYLVPFRQAATLPARYPNKRSRRNVDGQRVERPESAILLVDPM